MEARRVSPLVSASDGHISESGEMRGLERPLVRRGVESTAAATVAPLPRCIHRRSTAGKHFAATAYAPPPLHEVAEDLEEAAEAVSANGNANGQQSPLPHVGGGR